MDGTMEFVARRIRGIAGMGKGLLYLILLSVMAAVMAGFVTNFALALHRNFLTVAYDTAVFQNCIVNTLHGNWLGINGFGGPSLLGGHTTFVLVLLAPIYALVPTADTLFILQVWGVYSVVIPFYLVAKELLRIPFQAFFAASAAMASSFLFHMAMAPFHPESWIIGAVFWSYWFYLRDNRPGFLVSLIFAVSCGEQAALIYLALGASLLLTDDGLAWRRQYGTIALVAGLAWLVFAALLVSLYTHASHRFNIYAYHYSQWDIKSALGLAMAVAQNPMEAIQFLIDPLRWEHLAALIGVPLIAVLFSWRSILLFAPFPVYFLISDQEFFLYFHAYYYSFAFFAGSLGLLTFLGRWRATSHSKSMLLSGTFVISLLLLFPAVGSYLQLNGCRDDEFSKTLHTVFETIPPEATVYSPHRYSAYLSNRQNLVIGDLREEHLDFKAMMEGEFELTNVRADQVDYLVCDYMTDQCGWRYGFLSGDFIRRRKENIDRLLQCGQWRTFWSQNDVVILRRIK